MDCLLNWQHSLIYGRVRAKKVCKEKKRKVYANRHHDGSLCIQNQPKTAAIKQQSRKVTLWGLSPPLQIIQWQIDTGGTTQQLLVLQTIFYLSSDRNNVFGP